MNYEEMSDFEINKAVAEACGLLIQEIDDNNSLGMTADFHEKYPTVVWVADLDCITGRQCEPWWQFDPCNNPSDAWPIILDNNISICINSDDKHEWFAFNGHFSVDDMAYFYEHKSENVLRAACIVYLMMQEDK